MKNKEKVLQYIKRDGVGIEIGPSHNPIATKKEGYRVHIIDHMDREQLVEKYRSHGVDLEKIEEVDFVWRGQPYAELTGNKKYYDWIIASHVIEHTPDLIGFLKDCDSILKDDGVISLVVPDKRYCFDHFRPVTGLSRIIDSHFMGSKFHTIGTAVEYLMNVVSKSGKIAWNANTLGKYKFIHGKLDADQVLCSGSPIVDYVDYHAWCFVPHSFRLIIHDLYLLGLIPFREIGFYPTVGYEFYITLGRASNATLPDRMELLHRAEKEMRVSGLAVRYRTLASQLKSIIQMIIAGRVN